MLEHVSRVAAEFDILHFHIDYLHFPFSRRMAVPNITTLHGRLDIGDLRPLYSEFTDMPVVSISNSQREPLPQANWVGTVYHGLPPSLVTPNFERGDYLAFVGRISPEKRVDRAIEVARRVGLPLRVAAKIDAADATYYRDQIAPLFELPFVEFMGEVTEAEKETLLRGARALLFLIDWREPFGLVMIEAMACGTPVVAWHAGSVPEVMNEGVSGFIVDSLDKAVDAARKTADLDRRKVREEFDRRFTVERMAREYIHLYEVVRGL
jgi:glycosyltransferase involved in cell wall biosynthesis